MTTIHVTASRDYDVLVQPGLLDDAGAQIAQVLGTGCTPRGSRRRSRARAFTP